MRKCIRPALLRRLPKGRERAKGAIVAIILVALLLPVSLPVVARSPVLLRQGPVHPDGAARPRPEQAPYSLSPGYYYYFIVESEGPGTQLRFTVTSSEQVDVYVMTSNEFAGFTQFGTKSAAYHTTATYVSQTVAIPVKGAYYLVVDNDISGVSVAIGVSFNTIPVDIYGVRDSPPAPTGIVDYGIDNATGTITPYVETLSKVTGTAVLQSVSAYNASVPQGASPYGAGLQLNEMLMVNTTSGQLVYWLQNVFTFYTNNDTAYILDNVWNASTPNGVLKSSQIEGSGSIYPISQRNYYAFAGNEFTYSYPIALRVPIQVSHTGNRAFVAFGFAENAGATPTAQPTIYDNVTLIERAPITSAAIVVSGYELTPNAVFYDSEFVFGGQCCSAVTTFRSMDATLSMSYLSATGQAEAPRELYQFGSDTAEMAYGISTSQEKGSFQVSLGPIGFSGFRVSAVLPVPITVGYAVSDGSRTPTPPVFTYFANGTLLTSTLGSAPTLFVADGGTTWAVTPSFKGASGERWEATGSVNGTASSGETISITYYHQYLLNASYSLVGGGSPSPPTLDATALGVSARVPLGTAVTATWVDSGSRWSLPNLLGGSSGSQRWETGSSTSGVVDRSLAISPSYFEQFLLTVNLTVVGGGSPGDVPFNVTSLGVGSQATLSGPLTEIWADGSSSYQAAGLTASSGTAERWISNSTLSGQVTSALTVPLTYYHQYYLSINSSTSNGETVLPASGWYDSGASVQIRSQVGPMTEFGGWTGTGPGSYSGPSNSSAVTMEGPVSETAVFYPGVRISAGQGGSVSYLLGAAAGTVGPGESVVVYAPAGTTMVLTAQPSLLQQLIGWSGAVTGAGSAASFPLTSPSQVAAVFGIDFVQVGGLVAALFVVLALVLVVVRRVRSRAQRSS